MRTTAPTLAIAALLLGSLPLAAQELPRPDGWNTRFDDSSASETDLQMWATMAPGWHITSGPAGIYWASDAEASGNFRLEMEVYLFDPQGRREAFGVFFGGRDLDAASQSYSYFLIRDGGQFILKRRDGAEAPTVQGWTSHNAVRAYVDRGEEATIKNVLTVEAGADEVRFLVNGTEVARQPRSAMPVDGMYGFRVNHALNLHVSRLELTDLD